MEEGLSDPLDISKEPQLIKDSQSDISKVDVLVCGECHETFHFVEEFQEHKSNKCERVSTLKTTCANEVKPQVWGFTLWKNKQLKTVDANDTPSSSWTIYQRWCKLEPNEKDLWISAGQSLQAFDKLSSAKLQEFKVREDDKKIDKDPLSIEDFVEKSSGESQTVTISLNAEVNELIKKGILKPITLDKKNSRTGVKSSQENETKEFVVEKILAKRYNPKRRTWEYEVKWENYEELTWEPLAHLENCKALVDEFELKVKEQKEKEKEKPATPGTASRGRGRPRLSLTTPRPTPVKKTTPPPLSPASPITSPHGRPQRTSKQKALNQVKAWCGNISDSDEVGSKRPFEDDSDDSFEKKLKFDDDSEDTDYEESTSQLRKVPKIINTYNNGSTMKKLPSNVLIPDAKGVVRISQKQLPSLSSGVYIMSKSSGIIKLDPAASKLATSGGQTILKVSPKVGQKIGQAHIKLIKKSDMSPLVTSNQNKILKPVIRQVKKIEDDTTNKTDNKIVKPVENKPKILNESIGSKFMFNINNDDSDDGIEEMEFPTDLPLPQPESPPGEFTLDPTTGKIAGLEYPEKIEPHSAESSVDNIVQLAAADITEDDLKTEPDPIVEATPPIVTPTTQQKTALNSISTTITTKSTPSILNTAIANSNILQKTLLNSPPVARQKNPPKVINQVVASRASLSVTPVIRSISTTASKRPYPLPKPKINISPSVRNSNVYSKNSVTPTKKIGEPTAVYKRTIPKATPKKEVSSQQQQHQKKVVNRVAQAQQKVTPKPVISMPSLTMDDEPIVAPTSTETVIKNEISVAATTTSSGNDSELTAFSLADNETPMFITGDDGTVYQVAGQNEEGQTILVTQDSNGQQQCLLVTNEAVQEETQQEENVPMDVEEQTTEEEQPVVAQFIRTEPPSPGGTHKVVVMLPGGDVMVTAVTPEEYASLAVDK